MSKEPGSPGWCSDPYRSGSCSTSGRHVLPAARAATSMFGAPHGGCAPVIGPMMVEVGVVANAVLVSVWSRHCRRDVDVALPASRVTAGLLMMWIDEPWVPARVLVINALISSRPWARPMGPRNTSPSSANSSA